MRVLFTSTPGTGHVLHMIPLARAATAAGHEVRWATGTDPHTLLARAGVTHVEAGIDLATRAENLAARARQAPPVPPRQRRVFGFAGNFGATTTAPMLADLRRITAEWRPHLIVHEPCELAAAIVARELGIAHVTVGFGRLLPPHILPPCIESLAPLWKATGADVPDDLGLYEHLYLHPLPASIDPLDDGPPVVRLRPTGYDGSDDDAPLHPATEHRPEVYVTFGTEFAGVAPWRAVVDALAVTGSRALLTVGGALDPAALGPLPPTVRVERWVPQRQALLHSQLVVSHGGSGAMLGALIAGVPHLALPIAADQFDNGDLLTEGGVGAMIEPDDVSAESVAAALAHLGNDDAVTQRLGAVQEHLAAMPTPAEVLRLLERLAG